MRKVGEGEPNHFLSCVRSFLVEGRERERGGGVNIEKIGTLMIAFRLLKA